MPAHVHTYTTAIYTAVTVSHFVHCFKLACWIESCHCNFHTWFYLSKPVDAGDMGSIPGLGSPLEQEMATHSNIFAWRIPWMEEPGGLQSVGLQRVEQELVSKRQQTKMY